jgi:ubiquinone biosynthesis protein
MRAPRRSLRRWQGAAGTAPRLALAMVRRGILPVGPAALGTLRREGAADLHWKVLGDALARTLRDAGPLLAKLGQILATRGDLLPPALCQRLEALYADQHAMRRSELRRLLRRAYPGGQPFEDFDVEPIAVGSIGQVHRARLKDGGRVVVKLVRPGVEAALQRDLDSAELLADVYFASLARGREDARRTTLRLLGDLASGLASEADLEREAAAYEEFGRRFAHNPRVRVPLCHREWSSREVLVLEELVGEPLSAVRARAARDREAARRAADLALREILRQVFDVGLFHADPHGGNLLLLEDGRLGLIDLGLTGELRPGDRRIITRAVRAFLARDTDAVLRVLLEFGTTPEDFDLSAFRADVTEVFQEYQRRGVGAAASSPRLEELVDDLLRTAHRYGVHLPPSTTLLIKTLVTIEGVARSLDPEIDVAARAWPIVLRSLVPRWLRWASWWRPGSAADPAR